MNASIPTVSIVANSLHFSCPGVHAEASLDIRFQRTLRLPDDERDYPLPPGLGEFPLCPVEQCAGRVPNAWQQRGGAVLPMYQAEAMWLNFLRWTPYPFALKIAAGKINAITGEHQQSRMGRTANRGISDEAGSL